MGVADIVPGVSGGTIALITGIYERLVEAISQVSIYLEELVKKRSIEEFKKDFTRIYLWFLLPLLIGIGSAFILLSRVIKFLLDAHTAMTYAFFFGLIIASVYFVAKKIKGFSIKTVLSSIIGFAFAFFLIGFGVMDQLGHSYAVLLFSGAIALCAMILPGISGSFILLLLDQYEYMMEVLHNFEISKIITFISGGAIGLLLFSRLLNYLLKNHKSATMAFLSGLMLGALRLPYEKIAGNLKTTIFPIIIVGVIGFALVILLECVFERNTRKKPYLEDVKS